MTPVIPPETIPAEEAPKSVWRRLLTRLAAAGAVLWKFKAFVLLASGKAKLLLLGLTKLSTLLSMLASLALYWHWYGWRFALGFVLSIYVHEMGHVAALARYGIAATAPMFIPGLGAIVRLKQYPANVAQDARVGLAGPIWGLAAAAASEVVALATGSPLWAAIARSGAWINLFNLIPIWQLDGGRGFRALTRHDRVIILGIALVLWVVTGESMLLLIALGALYRLFSHDYPEQADRGVLIQFVGLLAVFAALLLLIDRVAQAPMPHSFSSSSRYL